MVEMLVSWLGNEKVDAMVERLVVFAVVWMAVEMVATKEFVMEILQADEMASMSGA